MSSEITEKYMTELENFAKNIKDLRKQYNYTQKYVAQQLGITYQSYQAYELGITVPTLQNFIKLAKFYDVPYEDLLS